jgi:hypothetical protein
MSLEPYYITSFLMIYLLSPSLHSYFHFLDIYGFNKLSILKNKKFIRMKTPSEWLIVPGLAVLSLF